MRTTPRWSLASASVAVLAVGFLATGAIVAGAHDAGPSQGRIHACVNDRTGELEVIGANQHCGPNATSLDWKALGREGNQGRPGPVGATGPGVGNLTVATATENVPMGAGGSSGRGTLGVDCPGDAVATGGGGIATPGIPSGIDLSSTTSGHLHSSVPLEQNSTTNVAEPGDTATGWLVSGSPPVSVFVVCETVVSPDDR